MIEKIGPRRPEIKAHIFRHFEILCKQAVDFAIAGAAGDMGTETPQVPFAVIAEAAVLFMKSVAEA